MSKGSPVVCVRIPPLTLAALDAAIEAANGVETLRGKTPCYSRTTVLLAGVSHMIDVLQVMCEADLKMRQEKRTVKTRLKRLKKKIGV